MTCAPAEHNWMEARSRSRPRSRRAVRRQGPLALSAGGPGRPSDPRAPVTGTVRGRWPGGSSFEGGTETRSSTQSPEPHSCAPLGDRHPGLRGHRRVASSRPLLLLETSSYGLVPGNVVTGEHACTREALATPCLSWAVRAEWPPGSSGSPVPRAQPPGPATGLCPPPSPPRLNVLFPASISNAGKQSNRTSIS